MAGRTWTIGWLDAWEGDDAPKQRIPQIASEVANLGQTAIGFSDTPITLPGVTVLPRHPEAIQQVFPPLDILVVMGHPAWGARLAANLRLDAPLVLWTNHLSASACQAWQHPDVRQLYGGVVARENSPLWAVLTADTPDFLRISPDASASDWLTWLRSRIETRKRTVARNAKGNGGSAWQAYQCLIRDRNDLAISFYEAALTENPDDLQSALYQGLAMLLAGEEEEGRGIWMMAMMAAGEAIVGEMLTEILSREVARREATSQTSGVESLLKLLCELDIENSQYIVKLTALLARQSEFDEIVFSQCLAIVKSGSIESSLKMQILEGLCASKLRNPEIQALIVQLLNTSPPPSNLRSHFISLATRHLQEKYLPAAAQVRLAEILLQLQPQNLSVLVRLINLYQDVRRYRDSVALAEQFCDRAPALPQRIAAHYLLLRGLLQSGGQFYRAIVVHRELEKLIETLIQENPDMAEADIVQGFAITSFLPYLEDNPVKLHRLRRQLATFLQQKVRDTFGYTPTPKPKNKLHKIGYLSSCLRRNSVGHLGRWLLKYHDRDNLEVFAYSLRRTDDVIQQEIAASVTTFRDISTLNIPEIAQIIRNDNLDILIDLDSLTCCTATAVLALKPTPVQATWLGFDASELPAIDVFFVDDRVLPPSASEYYQHQLYRLPETFIAVDGFEVAVPSLRREDLDIPAEAVVYLSSQTGAKRHPENGRSQLQILKQVPNSYFLIKGLYSDRNDLRQFFEKLAAEVGVEAHRLRFLPDDPSEALHRAHLTLADVVLDTYPYNGATTTLETLWMGIPVVTQVGEQFASRHSYDFLQQVGVREGIADTAEAYIDWGVRLGCDRELRERVAWKLRQSRQTSPLWNARRFARQMESAYAAVIKSACKDLP